MVFHPWIYCTLIQLTPFVIIPYTVPNPLLFSSFQCVSLCHLPTQMQCILILVTLYHALFLSLLPLVASNSPTITNMFYIYIDMWSHLYLSIYLPSTCGYPVFPALFTKEAVFSPTHVWLLCQILNSYSCMDLCLGLLFSSISLCVCFCASTMMFLLLWLCIL
jgi:hypothetical protein